MKALKEKRIGVRSLLRRGLIILSLFALVFAVACGGDDGSNSTPTPDPDPGTTPPPAATTVTDIVVLKQPTNVSFQGAPPDLTGLVARVYFSDGTSEMISDPTKFVGVPSFCDAVIRSGTGTAATPSTIATNATENLANGIDTTHAIAYAGHTEKTAAIVLPWVVPLKQFDDVDEITGQYTLQLTGSAQKTLYADQIPTFEGLVLEGFYEDYIDADGTFKTGQKRAIPITASYPTLIGLDDFDPDDNPVLSFGVGFKGVNGTDKDNKVNYDAYVSFNIDKILQVSGISVDLATSTFGDYFDDDVNLVNDKPADILKNLTDNNTINLIVSYFDTEESRTITFAEYLANLAYYNSRQQSGQTVDAIKGSDGAEPQSLGRTTPTAIKDILNISEDAVTGLPYFNVVMNYVPSIWGADLDSNIGTSAWLHTFDIPIPVYTFYTAVATRKAGSGTSDVSVEAEKAATPIATTPSTWADTPRGQTSGNANGDHLMQGLVSKWELTGTYEREGVMKEKKVPLTPQMFADALVTAPLTTPGVVTATFRLDWKAQGYDWSVPANNTNGIQQPVIGRGYVLPIWYRGETINDAEMGAVTVNLVGPAP